MWRLLENEVKKEIKVNKQGFIGYYNRLFVVVVVVMIKI